MIAADLLKIAQSKGVMITTAESCTGGLIAGAITEIPGSSAMFDRGFVTYSNDAKTEMLGVPVTLITDLGAVSQPVAEAMAQGALSRSKAGMAISVTGVAGPGGTTEKPEGMVCFGIATEAGVQSETQQFGAIGRARVRAKTVDHALLLCIKALTTLTSDK